MKKVIFVCIAFFIALSLHAQSDSERMGDTAFSMGNYYDAMELYDAAITLSKDRASEIQKKRSKASKCFSLKKAGDSFFASEAYEDAQSKYQQLLSLNPSDKSAKERLGKLGGLIAARKAKESKIRELQQIDKAYYDALKSGVDDLEKFCLKYPDSEQVHKADIVINALKQGKFYGISTEISLYNQIGNDFKKIWDADKARKFYDYSASLADPEGLYLKASTYKKDSKAYITLMAMSASAGYKPAIEKLDGVKHNEKIAEIYYSHLKKYRNELLSAIFVKENLQTYYLDYAYPVEYIVAMADKMLSYTLPELRSMNADGNVAYYIAGMVKDDARFADARITLLYYAASGGNADASYQLAKMVEPDKFDLRTALYICAANGGIVLMEKSWSIPEVRNYVSFMKNGKANDSWKLYLASEYPLIHLGTGVINKHEALLNCCQLPRTSFHYRCFKRFWKEHHGGVWDKDYIARVTNYLSEKNDNYSKKMLKKVSKLKLEAGIYTSELAELIKYGLVDNQYRYSCPVVRCDVLMPESGKAGL